MSIGAAGSGAILRHRWQRELGPFLNLAQAGQALSLTDVKVTERAEMLEILAVRDSNGAMILPSFALDRDPLESRRLAPVPELAQVLLYLTRTMDEPWLWTLWLSGTLPKHGGWCAVELLIAGNADVVHERARNEDWSWVPEF